MLAGETNSAPLGGDAQQSAGGNRRLSPKFRILAAAGVAVLVVAAGGIAFVYPPMWTDGTRDFLRKECLDSGGMSQQVCDCAVANMERAAPAYRARHMRDGLYGDGPTIEEFYRYVDHCFAASKSK
jgi:hypothetical protein